MSESIYGIPLKEMPKLYKKTSTGTIQEWLVQVIIVDGDVNIITQYGQVGGKIQTSFEKILEGKNIGKANETTPITQGISQAEANWKKQLKKGYVQSIEEAQAGKVDAIIEGGIAPMLAHKFNEQGHKIKFPALAQPKLDGHRCTSQWNDAEVTLWSRTRKIINSVPHINEALEKCGIADRFDGELYNHDYHNNFEELSSKIRQEKPMEGCEIIQYHIYDFPHERLTNADRNALLQNFKTLFENTPIHIVETLIVNDEDELMDAFNHFVSQGYEGCMVRNADGLYVNKRSYDLQKIKEFDDAEFEIVGVKVGTKGSMAGKAVFTCKLPKGILPSLSGIKYDTETFDCKMKGSLESLIQYAEKPELAIGKMLTVKFQGYTKYGVPRFPVGLRFREDI